MILNGCPIEDIPMQAPSSTKPEISVVVPVFNYGRYLARARDSLLGQKYVAPQIVVVDDGSTDDTWEVLSRYEGGVQALHQSNAGVSAARNAGIREARGEYIGFLDPDDFYHPEKLYKQAALLKSRPECGWTFCDCVFFDENTGASKRFSEQYRYSQKLALEGERLFEALIPSNFIPPLSLLIRRDLLDLAGHFDTRFSGLEDFDLVLRLAALSPAIYSGEILATYTWHSGGLGQNRQRMDRDKYIIIDKIATLHPEKIRKHGRASRKAVADMHNWFARGHMEQLQWSEALLRLLSSLSLYPFQRRALWTLVIATMQNARSLLKRGRRMGR
jgi:glycosyltransferase involved in cell wall biosynthesis